MKYIVRFFVITFLLITSTYALAEQNIVFMDMKQILNTSKAGKGAQDYLQKLFADGQKKFTNLESDLKKEESDLLAKKNILSKEEYKKNSDKLREKVIKYQKDRRESLDKIAQKRSKAREDLIKKLNPIVEKYQQQNNISLIIDKKNILAGSNNLDITNKIIEILNKELPALKLK